MHHPLTKEKKVLTELAERIRVLKLILKVKYKFPSIDPRTMPNLQQTLSHLRRSFRHRHIGYCLVRQGVKWIFDIGDIETKHTHEKANMNLVNMHRLRLLIEITQAYSDYTNKLVKRQVSPPLCDQICPHFNKVLSDNNDECSLGGLCIEDYKHYKDCTYFLTYK